MGTYCVFLLFNLKVLLSYAYGMVLYAMLLHLYLIVLLLSVCMLFMYDLLSHFNYLFGMYYSIVFKCYLLVYVLQ